MASSCASESIVHYWRYYLLHGPERQRNFGRKSTLRHGRGRFTRWGRSDYKTSSVRPAREDQRPLPGHVFWCTILGSSVSTRVKASNPTDLSSRIGGAIVDRMQSSTAWRYVLLVVAALAAGALLVTILQLMLSKRVAHELPIRPLAELAYNIVDLVIVGGAILCLQLALHFGALHVWRSARVISLFVVGFGGCLGIWLHLSKWSSSHWRTFKTTLSPAAFLTFLWGVSYHSFCHFLRKIPLSIPENQANSQQHCGCVSFTDLRPSDLACFICQSRQHIS
jgi:hypothetical protein